MIHAIPTRYNGVQMRSRLEARWAAFFDYMRWPWHYEPFDTNGWIPDFVLGNDLRFGLLVEIKPIEWQQNDRGTFNCDFGVQKREIDTALRNIDAHNGLLVCGLRPREMGLADRPDIHWMFGMIWCATRRNWKQATAYRNKITGIYDTPMGTRGMYPGGITGDDYDAGQDHIEWLTGCDDMREGWREAGNAVQWRAPT